MENKVNERDIVIRAQKMFDDSETSEQQNRLCCERDKDYYDGYQLTQDEIRQLKGAGMAPVALNKIKPKMDTAITKERRNKTRPDALPNNPESEQGAIAATEAIRYVLNSQKFDKTRVAVFEDALIYGTGVSRVDIVKSPKGEIQILINHVNWDRFFYDRRSRERDFKDARYVGEVFWDNLESVQNKFPDKADALRGAVTLSSSSAFNTYDDKPNYKWVSDDQNRVMLIDVWYKMDGTIYQTLIAGNVLLSHIETPFKDDEGNPEWPFDAYSQFVDRDGNRYGSVRNLIDLQDEVNKRRQKGLYLSSVRQLLIEEGAVDDIDQVRSEFAKPDGCIVIQNPQMKLEIVTTTDMAQAQYQYMQQAIDEIEKMGFTPSQQGVDAQELSGKALGMRLQAANSSTDLIFDIQIEWKHSVYRKVWRRIKQYWTNEKWLRTTTQGSNSPEWLGLNIPITEGQMLLMREAQKGVQITPELEQQALTMTKVIKIDNNVAEMDVDIVLEDVPDTPTIETQQFDQVTRLVEAGIQLPPDVVIEASSLKNKQSILKRLRGEVELPPEVQQQLQLLTQQNAELQTTVDRLQIEAGATVAIENIRAQNKIDVAQLNADKDVTIQQMKSEMEAWKTQQESQQVVFEEKMKVLDEMIGRYNEILNNQNVNNFVNAA